jgi:hypothetical protein
VVLRVDERDVNMTSGMAVSAEIATGRRRVIDYFGSSGNRVGDIGSF